MTVRTFHHDDEEFERLQALNAELVAALKAIRDHEVDAVTDKIEHDYGNCADCKSMENHPISRGRCNEWFHQHYRIEAKRKNADDRQQYQMRRIAREVLDMAESQ